jgi:magnesium-transporting ATPase (P-type)
VAARQALDLALDRLAGLGVTVKVITGDHPTVAVRVCRDAVTYQRVGVTIPARPVEGRSSC